MAIVLFLYIPYYIIIYLLPLQLTHPPDWEHFEGRDCV